MILNDDDTYDSMSEGEMDALEQVAMHRQVNDEEEQVFCDEDSSPALVVSKVLTLQHHQEEDQRCHIFHTKAGINGRSVKVIINGGMMTHKCRGSIVAFSISKSVGPNEE